MNPDLSVGDLFSRLKVKLAELKEQVAFHREQEAFHHEQGELLGAELERLTRHHAVFQETAAAVLGLGGEPAAKPAKPEVESGKTSKQRPGARPKLARMVAEVIESFAPDESFGRSRIVREVEQRYGGSLRKSVEPRLVSISLQRLADSGRIHQISKGRPHHEALFSRQKPPSSGRGK